MIIGSHRRDVRLAISNRLSFRAYIWSPYDRQCPTYEMAIAFSKTPVRNCIQANLFYSAVIILQVATVPMRNCTQANFCDNQLCANNHGRNFYIQRPYMSEISTFTLPYMREYLPYHVHTSPVASVVRPCATVLWQISAIANFM